MRNLDLILQPLRFALCRGRRVAPKERDADKKDDDDSRRDLDGPHLDASFATQWASVGQEVAVYTFAGAFRSSLLHSF
jgi:hypothetical protein